MSFESCEQPQRRLSVRCFCMAAINLNWSLFYFSFD